MYQYLFSALLLPLEEKKVKQVQKVLRRVVYCWSIAMTAIIILENQPSHTRLQWLKYATPGKVVPSIVFIEMI